MRKAAEEGAVDARQLLVHVQQAEEQPPDRAEYRVDIGADLDQDRADTRMQERRVSKDHEHHISHRDSLHSIV